MNNLFNRPDVTVLLSRIENLRPDAQRQWGKMEVAQMLAHCNAVLETAMGKKELTNIPLLLRLLGRMMKPAFFGKKPLPKNTGTAREYFIRNERNFDTEKEKAIRQIKAFCEGGAAACPARRHVFFGKLTSEEWAILQWKHFDHHLRQFGV